MKTSYLLALFLLFGTLYFFTQRNPSQGIRSPGSASGESTDLSSSSSSSSECESKGRILTSSGDITLPPYSFIIQDYFEVYFEFDTTDITMVIKCTTPGRYFSLGFGSSKMSGSDMWVFTLKNSAVQAVDYYGTGDFTPPTDTSGGGTNDLVLLGWELTSSYSLAKVKRALHTGDSRDVTLSQAETDIIFATGPSHSLVDHGPTRGHVKFYWRNGIVGLVLTDDSSSGAEDIHGILNILTWGFLVDVAILVARYLRGTKFTIKRFVITAHLIHSVLMWITFILSALVTITLLLREGESGIALTGEAKHDFHVYNGFVILGLSALAVMIGVFNYWMMKKYQDTVGAKVIQNLKTVHLLLGLILYLLTKVNIIIGAIFYAQGNWEIPVFVYLGILLIAHILLQLKLSRGFKCLGKVSNSARSYSLTGEHAYLLKAINNGTPLEKILADFPKIKWVQLGNGVYDLSNWVHPGGNFIIEACIGREVGRYFYGNYALEGTTIKPHKHSQLAVSQIKKFYIGDVTSSESILVHKDTKEGAQSIAQHHSWKIISFKPISDTLSQINFISQHFNVKGFGSSLGFLSRHFKVSFNRKGSVARQYTTALALTEANTRLRQDAYNYFKSIMDGNANSNFNSKFQSLTDSLPLFIKSYPYPKALSKALYDVSIDGSENNFIVEGPIGRGLELTESSTGTHAIICAGTGILPFVDFLNIFLFKVMYQAIKEKAGVEKAEKINVYNIPFDKIMEGLKVNFIGSFANKKEVIGLDIIEKLAEINNKYKIDCFGAIMRGHGDENIVQTKEYFSEDFLKKNLDITKEKYYIVGPPKMNAEISRDLARLGVAKNKIILV